MKIWIDVEDLFQYAAHVSRPSGIQRLAFELQRAMLVLAPEEVRFVRHGAAGKGFKTVSFFEINALFTNLSKPSASAKPQPPRIEGTVPPPPRVSLARRIGRRLMALLPLEVAGPLRHFRVHQVEALRGLRYTAHACFRRALPKKRAHLPVNISGRDYEESRETFDSAAAPGDWLLCVGSPWFAKDYGGLVGSVCAHHGLRFALLVYDIIPLRRPEWCDKSLVSTFSAWFHSVAPLADRILAISRTTAEDTEKYAAETSLRLRSRIQSIPLGTGFGQPPAPLRSPRLPPPGSFALIVSTIEARKNHALLLRIWRELLATMPREQVPTLVFAGRVGWLVADLMQQLENANWLDGKVRLIEAPSDGELAALYEDCLFTLYPSLYEGWGLPVTESLAHGTPCLAANATSLPEAGGTLARYFDPDNLHDAVRAVRAVLDDPAALGAWGAEIQQNFRPVSWSESAAATLRILRAPDGAC